MTMEPLFEIFGGILNQNMNISAIKIRVQVSSRKSHS